MKPALRLAALASAAATPLLLAAGPAQAATPTYVALGDSYSAGVGTYSSTDAACYRSPKGWAPRLAAARGYALSYQACSGATTTDVLTTQLSTITGATTLVTVTAGGNDVGFAPTLTACAQPSWMADCYGQIAKARAVMNTTLPGNLDRLYGTIRSKVPANRVFVAGYPRLFNGTDCHWLTFFSSGEMNELNKATNELDTLIQARAGAAGMSFVDVRGAFAGHEVCSSAPWINNLSLPIVESYHPNSFGQSGYLGVVSTATRSVVASAVVRTGVSAVVRTGVSAADGADAADAPGGADATGGASGSLTPASERETYRRMLPTLTTAENLARAGAKGIPAGLLRQVERDLRSGDLARQRAAVATLHRLDAAAERR